MRDRFRIAVVTLVAVALCLAAGCSKRDQVIGVKGDDPEMVAAIAKARSTLPQFWEVFDKPDKGETNFSLKVAIKDQNGTEHFWATQIERHDGKIMGTINNAPSIVESIKFGDRIEIPEADISDWLYARGGKMVGNQTVRPLFKKMPAAEVAWYKKVMAEP